ncbi:MAG: hypothetical protein K2L75_03330 [Muribaculaceae bacterium]|nr:hypothetical protein [Muribaculaceae bacterium]
MRIEVMGANVTTIVAEVLDTLQNDDYTYRTYMEAIDWAVSSILLADEPVDEDDPRGVLSHLRQLYMLQRDLTALARPADADLEENDTPTASF